MVLVSKVNPSGFRTFQVLLSRANLIALLFDFRGRGQTMAGGAVSTVSPYQVPGLWNVSRSCICGSLANKERQMGFK